MMMVVVSEVVIMSVVVFMFMVAMVMIVMAVDVFLPVFVVMLFHSLNFSGLYWLFLLYFINL